MPDKLISAPEKLFFENVKEHRGSYFVEYQPPQSDNAFATLNLVFPGGVEPVQAATLIRLEVDRWLKRYPVPLMASAFDASEDLIRVNDGGDAHLVGWLLPTGKVVTSWKLDDLRTYLKTAPPHPDWRTIYADVPFRTSSQVKADADKYVQERRQQNFVLKLILLIWVCVIPATWAIVQYLGPEWLGLVVLIYSLWQIWRTWMKMSGRAKPSQAELEKAEKERKMAHYYYHCERNPIGFERLKAENFEKSISERTRKEAEELAEATGGSHHGS
jgi:hypothetical protein